MTVPKTTSDTLRSELDAALTEVTKAEDALAAVLRELRTSARAEKVTISEAVESAFARLRSARTALAKLRALVDG